jgi:hypothetical protein
MDVSLTNSIVSTATALSNNNTAQAVNVAVMKKAMNAQESAAATLLAALPQTSLATSGHLGTQVNTFA